MLHNQEEFGKNLINLSKLFYVLFLMQEKKLHYNSTRNFAVQQFDSKKNYDKILDVNEKSSQIDIKKAFYKLAKQYHPDVNKGIQAGLKR